MSNPIKYINAGPMQAQASAGAAMAPGQALENVGNAIAQTGELGLNVLERVRKVRDTGTSAAFMAQAEEEADRFALSLAKRSDTDAWPQEWKNKADNLRKEAKDLPLSSEAMASLNADLVGWHGKKAIQFETQAVSKELAIGHARVTQNLDYNTARLNKFGFDRDLKHAVDAGIYNPAEAEAAKMNFRAQEARVDIERMVTANPSGFVDMPTTEFLKRVSGSTIEMIEPAKRVAKGLVKERALDTVEAAQDDIYSGKLQTAEAIDQDPRYAALRPTVREKLKNNLEAYQFEKAQGLMNTPEAQASVVGKVSAMMADWEPKADDQADEKYADIQGQIGRLPDGSMKTELVRQAKAIRSGAWAESENHADAAMKALDAAGKAGRFGITPKVAEVKLSEMVADGFLKDATKLQRLGYSEDQAGQIVEAASTGAAGGQRTFTELWKDRTGGSIDASEFEIATAEALRLGHATIKGFEDSTSVGAAMSARQTSETRLGEAKMRLAEYLRINPAATPADIDNKILDISGEQTVRELRSGIYDGKRARGTGASVDIKLSNYGYADDSTPDSYSARGIGHANNALEDGKSAAISKSLANRLNLSTGDEVEIETTKGVFRVRYDDTVPSTDSRTGDLPETIDLYRKKDGSNAWGGKVTKIRKVY